MNEDDISKTSKDSIPDAKYYLVRPKNSEMLFIMDKNLIIKKNHSMIVAKSVS